MEINDIIGIIGLFGILLLIASGIGFAFGFIGCVPFKLSDQIELNTEIASSNTTLLYNVPANTYRLNYHVKIYGYKYDLLGGIVNHTGGLHGPNYANITFLTSQGILFSKAISEIPADKMFRNQLNLNQTINITVEITFTIKNVPENRDFYFNAIWIINLEEDDFFKEVADIFYINKDPTLFWGLLFIIGSYITSKLES